MLCMFTASPFLCGRHYTILFPEKQQYRIYIQVSHMSGRYPEVILFPLRTIGVFSIQGFSWIAGISSSARS